MLLSRIHSIAILVGLSVPAATQMSSVEDYLKLITIDPKTLSVADCTAGLFKANALNSAGLFRASAVCARLQKDVESSFLLSAAQVRATADMTLMAPATKADLSAVTALYGFIYAHAGGPGKDEVFRDPVARDRFFDLLGKWKPTYSIDYAPGWAVGERPDAGAYRLAITEAKAGRRLQLTDLSKLYSDGRYYALHRQMRGLDTRTSGKYVEGTADEKQLSALRKSMTERARQLGVEYESDDSAAAKEDRPSPPSAPGKGEVVVTDGTDPLVKQCSDWAKRLAQMSVSKIAKVVITTSSEWGLVWRADIASSDQPPEMSRFICSINGTMHQSGNGSERPPLP